MKYQIPYLDLKKITSSFEGELEKAVSNAVTSGWYLHGCQTDAFEKEYAAYIGANHCIACASGLDALYLILRGYLELGTLTPGDEVIVPANTFIATILAISEAGLVPVLVEPDAKSYNLNPDLIEQAITPRTRAVMMVHLYGQCAYTEKIGEICRRHGLLLLEDNAQAHGCRYVSPAAEGIVSTPRTGSLGNAAAHSFYPGKNLGALGDAGAITTDDALLADIIRSLANYGSSRKYVFDYVGRNSRMDELQAAALRIKLPRLDADNERRRELAARYLEEITNPLIRLPYVPQMASHVFHIFPVMCERRDDLQKHFAESGIETLIHYPIPPHLQKCYRGKGILKFPDRLPITEKLHEEELSLPLHPLLTDAEADQIIQAANCFT